VQKIIDGLNTSPQSFDKNEFETKIKQFQYIIKHVENKQAEYVTKLNVAEQDLKKAQDWYTTGNTRGVSGTCYTKGRSPELDAYCLAQRENDVTKKAEALNKIKAEAILTEINSQIKTIDAWFEEDSSNEEGPGVVGRLDHSIDEL
jgi:hypothetical protein